MLSLSAHSTRAHKRSRRGYPRRAGAMQQRAGNRAGRTGKVLDIERWVEWQVTRGWGRKSAKVPQELFRLGSGREIWGDNMTWWVALVDDECYLLSGVDRSSTVTATVAPLGAAVTVATCSSSTSLSLPSLSRRGVIYPCQVPLHGPAGQISRGVGIAGTVSATLGPWPPEPAPASRLGGALAIRCITIVPRYDALEGACPAGGFLALA